MLLPDAMRQHSAAYWQRVSDHIDPYAAIMVDRRASVTVNRPILGIDGDTAAIRMPEADEPLLALGVGGSGKTASVITVNALLSPGPLVSTSSRSDVYLATALSRARVGRVWHLTARGRAMPSASQLRWSPLQGCGDFEYAQETAKRFADYRDMGTTARLDHGAHPHFRERSGALLAVLFFYAAQRGLDMEWVYARCASGNAKALNEVVNELNTTHHRPLIASALEGIITSAGPEMSGVMSTAARSINCYSTEAALRTQRDPNFDFEAFVRGRPYDSSGLLRPTSQWTPFDRDYEVIGMGRHEMGVYDSVFLTDGDSESPVLPIYLEFIYRVKEAAADYTEECRLNGQSTPKPTALVLDELRAMPVPQIERILTDCRERGIIVVGGIQSLKQAEDLYGDAGKDFLSAWRCALVFRGILDRDTLELISFLSGTYWEEVKGYSEARHPKHGRWEWSTSIRLEEQRRLKPEQIRMGRADWPDGALMVRRDRYHSWIDSIPYYRRDPWAKVLVNSAEHARSDGLDLPLPPLAKDGNYGYLAQLGLDQRFRELQNHRPALGGLCRRPSTSGRTKATPARSGTRHIKSRPTGEDSPTHRGRCGLSRASSTTSPRGSSSAGSPITSAATRSEA